MGASGWGYHVPYQADLQAALDGLRERVFEAGDYWWAAKHEFGTSASAFPDRPRTEAVLWSAEAVQESGTHSILDMDRVIGEHETPDYGTVKPVGEAEAVATVGVAKLTRAHVEAIDPLATRRWLGRCAVLHDDAGEPTEVYFWGFSGD